MIQINDILSQSCHTQKCKWRLKISTWNLCFSNLPLQLSELPTYPCVPFVQPDRESFSQDILLARQKYICSIGNIKYFLMWQILISIWHLRQFPLLQAPACDQAPRQSFGSIVSPLRRHSLVCVFVPESHVALHSDHSPHSDHNAA